MRTIKLDWLLLAIGLLTSSMTSAQVSFPNVRGIYAGQDTFSETGCTAPLPPTSSGVDPIVVVINSQSGANFSGFAGDNSGGTPATLSGTVDLAGNVSGTFVEPPDGTFNGGSGTFGGTLSGNTLSFSYSGADNPGPGACSSFGGSVVANRVPVSVVSAAAPGTIVTKRQAAAPVARAFATLVGVRINNVFRPQSANGVGVSSVPNGMMFQTGMAAGEDFAVPYGFWGSFSRTESEDDFSTTAFDSTRYNFIVGGDFSPREGLIMGLALGYETQEVDTFFNGGQQDVDGYTVVPYLALRVGEHSSLDLSFGYSSVDTDQFRLALVGGLPVGARVSSSVDSERYFFSGNYTTNRTYGNWNLTGQVGGLWAKDAQDAFSESNGTAIASSNFKVGQWRIGGEAAYAWEAFEPYARGTFQYDFTRTKVAFAPGVAAPKSDRSDVLAGFGVRYFANNGISGSLEYSTVLGRENYSEDTIQFLIRAEF